MYDILIVDDEMLARVGIKSMIDWNQYGFNVVGEAENGKKALQMAAELQPDIILTDIKMPLLNGVELIKKSREQGIKSKFIVLSAYDDFKYVKEAMQIGAEDYLIKLELQPEQLIEILIKVKDRIKQEKQKKPESEVHSLRNIEILRTNFLRNILLVEKYYSNRVAENIESLQMSLQEENIICYVVQPDCFDIYNKYGDEDVHLLDDAILNVVLEILQNYKMGYAIKSSEREFVILLTFEEISDIEIDIQCKEINKAIRNALLTYLNTSIRLGSSSIHDGFSSIHLCYKEASIAAERGFSAPKGSTIYYDDIIVQQMEKFEYIEEIKSFADALKIDDHESIKSLFSLVNEKLTGTKNISKKDITLFSDSLLFVIETTLSNVNQDWFDETKEKVKRILSLDDFRQWFKEFEVGLLTISGEKTETSKVIRKIKDYVLECYAEDISLEIVARQMNISANYLSNLFKKETEETLIDYITRVRITRAIELLQTTNKKIYEIGRLVGYENEHYFSRVFKKITGVSPTKYKI